MSTKNEKEFVFIPTKCCEIPPEDIKFPVYGTPKIDGSNAFVGEDGQLYGRSKKKFKNKQLNSVLSRYLLTGFCFEITVGSLKDRETDDICRRTTSYVNSIDKEVDEITISLFDYLGVNFESYCTKKYLERWLIGSLSVAMLKNITGTKFHKNVKVNIDFLNFKQINTPQEAITYYEWCLEQGYEGAIFRNDTPYKCGRSTKNSQETLRMKPQADSEAVVIGFIEAQTNNNEAKVNELGRTERSNHQENKVGNGMLGSFVCIDSKTGMEINVGAGKLSHQERIVVWDERDIHIGSIVKYRSMTAGVKDKPRFPRFISWRDKDDVDLSECHKDFLDKI